MGYRDIITGQKIAKVKLHCAQTLRRQMTEEEEILWQQIRASRLHGIHFRRQQIIDGFIVDFYCHSAGVVIEVDGGIHDRQTDRDAERDQILATRGLRVLRIKNQQIKQDLPGILARIVSVCKSR